MRDARSSASRIEAYDIDHGGRRRGGAGKRSSSTRVFATKRIGFLFSVGLLALAGIGVPMNALFFQDGRHPAPLFARAAPPTKTDSAAVKSVTTDIAAVEAPKPEATKIAAAPETAIRAPTRPQRIEAARVDPIAAAINAPRATSKPESPKVDTVKTSSVRSGSKKPVAEKKRDAIGQLIGGGAAGTDTPDTDVISAQRALLRLGYVVRADGVPGESTRQAIEKFERDNGLPPTGKISPRLMKKLAADAGLAR